MQFHINGRFLADIQREGDAWTVSRARPDTLPSLEDASLFARLEENDVTSWLDELAQEAAEPGHESAPGPA